MPVLEIVSSGASIKGEDHKENEDTILAKDSLGLYAVADGVTLPYGGRPASRLTISSLKSTFKGDLAEAVARVNATVLEEKRKRHEIGSSTLTAAHLTEGMVRIAHVGDSSALLIRDKAIILSTTPQNRGGFLTNTIGEYFEGATIYDEEIRLGDYLVLATDGITAVLNQDEIVGMVTGQKEPERIVEYTLREVGERPRHYRDDRSIIVVRISHSDPSTPRPRNTNRSKVVSTKVRKFEAGDLDQVLALAERYASWDSTPTKADVEGFRSANPEFFFVAEADKKIVGFVYGRESNPPEETLDKWRSRKVASIETLAVDEEHRRQGIATSLLRILFEAFKRNKMDLVTLSVPAVEMAAMKLYEKMGFETRAYFLWKRLPK